MSLTNDEYDGMRVKYTIFSYTHTTKVPEAQVHCQVKITLKLVKELEAMDAASLKKHVMEQKDTMRHQFYVCPELADEEFKRFFCACLKADLECTKDAEERKLKKNFFPSPVVSFRSPLPLPWIVRQMV